ncbi:SRPBCC domain-containing protein [Schaalia sp. Marseille-Q2122]|uniref:SRPBCC family protein n=1 Tax=Schaalia sp. Marseille-Q2122 TaxID=2736604 RepID=UPI00158B56CC|nr:SRPBCC domain-containing protein [Schaalia sp. Marseille-Q2122]
MVADVMIIVERVFTQSREVLFDAWTIPEQMSQWRGSPGTHVEDAHAELTLGGRQYHVKVLDDDPNNRVITESIFTEFFRPDVFVEQQLISGDPEIDPTTPMEQRVEFVATGRGGTLVRIIQGPYEARIADWHCRGWERELNRLDEYLARNETNTRKA